MGNMIKEDLEDDANLEEDNGVHVLDLVFQRDDDFMIQ